ncbi:hypothetical protein Tco_0796311, partial [Tanacetum coccineum]
MENQSDVQNHLVEIQADDHDLLVNSNNENDEMLGYESEKYSGDEDADRTNHAEDMDGTNHSDLKLVKSGITRLYKFRREYGKPGGIKIKVTFDTLNKVSGLHRALFSSFLGDIVREHIGKGRLMPRGEGCDSYITRGYVSSSTRSSNKQTDDKNLCYFKATLNNEETPSWLIKSSAGEASTAAAAPKCCLSNVLVLKEVSHYCLGTRMICAASVYFMLLMQDLMLPVVISYVNAAIDTTAIGFKRSPGCIFTLTACTLGLGPGCIFTLTAIAKWECSSYGRVLALHARGTRFEVGESSSAAAARQAGHTLAHRVDYGFIDTMDTSIYASESRVMTAIGEVNDRVTDLATTQ